MDTAHAARLLRLALLPVVLAGCKSQARKDHEALGASMRPAVNALCDSYMRVEGGGCVTTVCHDKRDARYGHAAVVASRGLVGVPAFADARTEAELAAVRMAARRVLDAYGAACDTVTVDPNDFEPSAEVTRCAAARNGAAVTGALVDAVDALAADVKARIGAEMPATTTCPADGS